MAKTNLDLTNMFGELTKKPSIVIAEKVVSVEPQPKNISLAEGGAQQDKVATAPRKAENISKGLEKAEEKNFIKNMPKLVGTKTLNKKNVNRKTNLVILRLKISEEKKDLFQALCDSYGYTMTEILKEFVERCIKKGKL